MLGLVHIPARTEQRFVQNFPGVGYHISDRRPKSEQALRQSMSAAGREVVVAVRLGY